MSNWWRVKEWGVIGTLALKFKCSKLKLRISRNRYKACQVLRLQQPGDGPPPTPTVAFLPVRRTRAEVSHSYPKKWRHLLPLNLLPYQMKPFERR